MCRAREGRIHHRPLPHPHQDLLHAFIPHAHTRHVPVHVPAHQAEEQDAL